MVNENSVSKAYKTTGFLRHPLTGRNQEELGIPAKVQSLLMWEEKTWRGGDKVVDSVRAKAQKAAEDGQDRWVTPVGFSLNKKRYGAFPDDEETAHKRGWYAYMNMGVPLVEERSDIIQPPPDMISKQTYVNRSDTQKVTWTNTVEFSISNTISWSLEGQTQLSFGTGSTAELQQQLQTSLPGSTASTTGQAKGVGEVRGALVLGITASVSGSLTTSWKQSSSLSGTIESRAVVMATQRRQVKRFDYELPITFGGYVALYYPEPVEFASISPVTDMDPKNRTDPPKYTQVIAHPVDVLGLVEDGKNFTQKGVAEVVSTLAGEHEVFELETLQKESDSKAPLYRS